MKAIILAGGLGTRLGTITYKIPKPMVPIDNKPILWHIMTMYAKYGINDFIIALGYKGHVIKDFFLNYKEKMSDFKINLKTGEIDSYNYKFENWNVHLVDTGYDTMTGGRIKRLKHLITDDNFLLTYGDGLSNVNINDLIKLHKSHGKMATVTAVRPNARFGELDIQNNNVKSFKEKPQIAHGWINGGFFVFKKEFIDLINDDKTVLEAEPLEKVANNGELVAHKHDGFWQCVDTPRDKEFLDKISIKDQLYPWIND
jgi:glucose-1-phosphate cytidylyltransferase